MDLILSLVTNYQAKAQTAVELSLNSHFKREYSSLYKALDSYYAPRNDMEQRDERRDNARSKIGYFLLNSSLNSNHESYTFFIDMTGNEKKHSHKTPDREYIHTGAINGMTVGHYYSAICLGAENSWMLALLVERIPYEDNKFDFSVNQMKKILEKVPQDKLAITIGDTAYNCNKFIYQLCQDKKVVTITRVRSTKVMFDVYDDKKEGVGRKRKYGKKHTLNKNDSLPIADSVEEFEEMTKGGKKQKVKLHYFKGYICRGSKDYPMSDLAMNFVKVEVLNEDGTRKYNRDLWLNIAGTRKDEILPKEAYYHYKNRFDIEHYFKFGKSKLLMNKLQSTNPNRDEDFMLIGMIAYHVLYRSSELLQNLQIRKWENKTKVDFKSPWQTYRAAANSNIFEEACNSNVKKRGVPTDKNIRKNFATSEKQAILRKPKDPKKLEISIKSSFENSVKTTKASLNINDSSGTISEAELFTKTKEICKKLNLEVA